MSHKRYIILKIGILLKITIALYKFYFSHPLKTRFIFFLILILIAIKLQMYLSKM